jgi:hypothetical protein
MVSFYNLLQINKSVINKFAILLATSITLFTFASSAVNETPTISTNSPKIVFYGTNKDSETMGAEYILFQDDNNHSAKGLIYVQNSDIFSCFTAHYDRQNQSFEQIIFAYPEMGTDEWLKNESAEKLSLQDFPYQLDYINANDNVKQLFNECLNYFENN